MRKNMKENIPQFLRNAQAFSDIYTALENQVDGLYEHMEDIKRQMHVTTATWGLKNWEDFLDIETNPSKSEAYRRSVILSKIRGVGKVTKTFVESTCKSFENGSLEVVEIPEESRLLLKFTELNGVPPNFEDFNSFITEVLPAHLVFAYEYKYNMHATLSGQDLTHAGLSAMTFNQIRTTNQWN